MDNSGTHFNILELETLRSELIERTFSTIPNTLRVLLYFKYFDIILTSKNPVYIEAYLKEFLHDYITSAGKFEIWGVDPSIAYSILNQLKIISALELTSEYSNVLNNGIERIERQSFQLTGLLKGEQLQNDEKPRALFPLIIKDAPEGFYGILESVTVRINKSVDQDKFIIVPSETEIERMIIDQCRKSWSLALSLSRQYVRKPFRYHEVIINFDKREGFYRGNSLGIALTLSFLEQILQFYNPAYIIKINEKTVFTGGVEENGRILNTGKEIISQKLSAVFFSDINYFVIPKEEEKYASGTLAELDKKYPGRKLKLIPAEEVKDILIRRDIIDIRKQRLRVRTGKFIRNNWISAAASVVFSTFLILLFLTGWLDDNPEKLLYDSSEILVNNHWNRTLFNFRWELGKSIDQTTLYEHARIMDINNDGSNEILIVESIESAAEINKIPGSLSCYGKNGSLIWNHSFQKIVSSVRETMKPYYGTTIVDTISEKSKKILVVYANNTESFASAVFKLDLKTGKQIGEEVWTAGFTYSAILADINSNAGKEFIGWGPDNGFNQPVLWAVSLDSLYGFRPTTNKYSIIGKEIAPLIFCLRFPKTDYDYYANYERGFSIFSIRGYEKFNNEIRFYGAWNIGSLIYSLNLNNMRVSVNIEDNFRRYRDSLIKTGKLSPPETESKEYKSLLTDQILYWKNGKWLHWEQLSERDIYSVK